MPITGDWQLEFGGLLLGDGTSYELRGIEGLASTPDLRTSDRTRLRRHGALPGDDFLGPRSVVVDLEVFGEDDASFSSAVSALKSALRPGQDEQPLLLRVPGVAEGGDRLLNARPRRLSLPVDEAFFYRQGRAAVEFFATDPRIYDDDESELSTGLATAGGGLTFPATFNLVFGAVSTGGSILADNGGTFDAPVVLRIDGPATNPSIENVTLGKTLAFTITLGSGEYLEVDTDARTVLLGGTSSRYSTLTTAEWFDLAPGVNELRFRAITDTAATLTATWRSAWL